MEESQRIAIPTYAPNGTEGGSGFVNFEDAKAAVEAIEAKRAGVGLNRPSVRWWLILALTHIPLFVICVYVVIIAMERIGSFLSPQKDEGRRRLPSQLPYVCVQIPLYNEARLLEPQLKSTDGAYLSEMN